VLNPSPVIRKQEVRAFNKHATAWRDPQSALFFDAFPVNVKKITGCGEGLSSGRLIMFKYPLRTFEGESWLKSSGLGEM